MSSYVLALDVGERRIGVALASRIARLPAPYGFIDRSKTEDVIKDIQKIVTEQEVDTIVVGLPRGLEGQESAQTQSVRSFAAAIEKNIKLPIVMQDEAVTSVEAENRLKNRGKPYSKGDIDAEAAAMILDDYLNSSVERTA